MSTYTPNVPISGQSLGNSRPIINNNFQSIQSTFDENHVDFNLSNAGAHTHVDMLAQSTDPNPATGLISQYSKQVGGVTEWFMQRENSGAVFQMSNGTPVASANGQTFLAGGVVMKYGNVSISLSATSTVVTFTTPFTSVVYSLQVMVTGGFSPPIWKVADGDYSLSGFTVRYSEPYVSTGHVFWMVIGV